MRKNQHAVKRTRRSSVSAPTSTQIAARLSSSNTGGAHDAKESALLSPTASVSAVEMPKKPGQFW